MSSSTTAIVLWSDIAAWSGSWGQFDTVAHQLSVEHRLRVEAVAAPSERRVRMLARVILHRALALLEAPGIDAVWFEPNGRPRLPAPWDLSISHTDGMACVAVATCAVGIDAEAVREVERSAWQIALTPSEQSACGSAEDPNREFLRHWTFKEAAAKADGRALALNPHDVRCRATAVEIGRRRWHTRSLWFAPEVVAAVAFDRDGVEPMVRKTAPLPALPA